MNEPVLCDPRKLNPPINPTLVTNGEGLLKVSSFLSRVDKFGFDTETNITKRFYPRRIRTIQVGDKNEQYVVDLLAFAESSDALVEAQGHRGAKLNTGLKAVVDTLRPSFCSKSHLKVGFNLGFDYSASAWCLGLRPWHFFDCFLAEKVIHAGKVSFKRSGFWAMDDCVERYFHMKISKEEQKSFDLCTPLTEEQIVYAAFDTRTPLSLMARQKKELDRAGLNLAAEIEFDAIPAFGDMHISGMKVDSEKWLKLVEDAENKRRETIKAMDAEFIPIVGRKGQLNIDLDALEKEWRDTNDKEKRKAARDAYCAARKTVKSAAKLDEKCEGEAAIQYSSNPQLLAALRKVKGLDKLQNTADKTLEKHSNVRAVKLLQQFREYDKILSTYGREFLEEYVDPDTYRIHSDVDQLGAESGRTSSRNPNLQNIPKGKEWRACFVARPGKKIITIDYAGQELRIITHYSREQFWVDAFNNDWDLHSVGAGELYPQQWKDATQPGCAYYENDHKKCNCPDHKKIRDKLKSANFGIAYGISCVGLAANINITKKEAADFLEEYYKKNPRVIKCLNEFASKAHFNGESRTLSGRRRLFTRPTWQMAIDKATREKKGDGELRQEAVKRALGSMNNAIEREGRNTPIQGSGADMVKRAVGCGFNPESKEAYLWHRINELNTDQCNPRVEYLNMVHDEIDLEADDEIAQDVMNTAIDCMKMAGAEFVKVVVMEAEGNIADCWSK